MYGKLIDGILHPAPRKLRLEDCTSYNPTPAQLEAAGYKPVVYTDPPEEPEGYYAEAYWTETAGEITQAWRLVELPPEEEPPPVWDVEAGQAFAEGDLVESRGVIYACIKAHTAAWSRQPPNDEYWEAQS